MSRWTLRTSWGLDMISFGSVLVRCVKSNDRMCMSATVTLAPLGWMWMLIVLCLLHNKWCYLCMHAPHCCKELLTLYLNLPHIPTCSLLIEENCVFPRRPSRLDDTLRCAIKIAKVCKVNGSVCWKLDSPVFFYYFVVKKRIKEFCWTGWKRQNNKNKIAASSCQASQVAAEKRQANLHH